MIRRTSESLSPEVVSFLILAGFGLATAALTALGPAIHLHPDGTYAPLPALALLRVEMRDLLQWLPFLILVLAVAPRLTTTRPRIVLPAHVALVAGCVLGYAAISLALFGGQERSIAWYASRDAARVMTLYLTTIGCWHAVAIVAARQQEALRARTLEAQLARAQLDLLQMQIQPHFLFNTLHAIGSMIQTEPRAAQRMVTLLGELLRTALDRAERVTVPLRDEIAWIERYLALQRLRFGERLRVRVDVEPPALDVTIPALLLQPLVENALIHGTDPETGACMVEIVGRREKGRLLLRVRDSSEGTAVTGALECGTAIGVVHTAGRGIGLANTRARLAALYGDASLEVCPTDGGTVVALDLPCEPRPASTPGLRRDNV